MAAPRMVLALLLLPLALACRSSTSTGGIGATGSFTASWVGADTGKLSGRPRAVFCAGENLLELTAVQGDVGVGLAVYPSAELASGPYDGFDPGIDSVRRPGVTGAARWFTEREIAAYQSDWGSLQLVARGPAVAGTFALHMHKVGADTDSIVLNGRFKGVVPAPCPADSVSPPPPAQ